ncbi:serine/threonine dehydratase [Shewanella sedimentimangrovi]|uniref:Serine/threonine dehydratase n=1 Tax=Shewanella sedimentimangrovi TaxID=2814293 RepID=A0ABX7R172_9GAMM|nr:serine/threonine dehydratase [Shewanella sedimentimangrovi]QSX37547.1 serine/threonine dehydratase [Shewanella sedimentimangrovi]
MSLPQYADVLAASERIQPYISETPIVSSYLLNDWLGHKVFFKAECLQRVGAFKLRGATNVLAWLKEQGKLPKKVVANSSGNHAQAVAYAARQFGVAAQIFSPQNVSRVKAAATRFYGAELVLCETRQEADEQVQAAAAEPDTVWIPPFNHPQIIAGQGTATLEALRQLPPMDGVFAPCGGGGLLSGTLLATRELCPQAVVVGAEPLLGNDAARSLRSGSIVRLDAQPDTLADGAATLAVGSLTFPLLQQLDDFYEVDEERIAYWTQWLQHLLKLHVEPTSAMSMEAVVQWLGKQTSPKQVLVILSGGNIDQAKMQRIWQDDHLLRRPGL